MLAFKWAFERAGFKTLALRADSSKYRSDDETKYDTALLIGAYTEGDQVNFVGGDCLVLHFCTSRNSSFGKYGDLATWSLDTQKDIQRHLDWRWLILPSQ